MRLSLAGFQVIMYGRFWVITEAGLPALGWLGSRRSTGEDGYVVSGLISQLRISQQLAIGGEGIRGFEVLAPNEYLNVAWTVDAQPA